MIYSTPGLEEKQAVARLKQGDLGGIEALVERYQPQAIKAAFLIVRDATLAEDIVEDAFLHAADRIDQFDDARPFGAWFLRSVVNAAIKTSKRQARLVSLPAGDAEESAGVAEWLLDPDPGPEFLVETQETRRLVWQALGKLPPEQRAVIVMRHFLEMDEKEMVRELERPSTTIQWRLKTARARLRKLLKPFWKPGYQEVQDER